MAIRTRRIRWKRHRGWREPRKQRAWTPSTRRCRAAHISRRTLRSPHRFSIFCRDIRSSAGLKACTTSLALAAGAVELGGQRVFVVPEVVRPEHVDAAGLPVDIAADAPHADNTPANYVLVEANIKFVSAEAGQARRA